MAFRYCIKKTYRQQMTQIRHFGDKKAIDEPQYMPLYPEKNPEDDEIPVLDRYADVPEDKYRFRRRKEGFPVEWITFMTQPIDLSPKSVKNWFYRNVYQNTVNQQSNVKERRILYGIELGAAVFVFELNGSVRFKNNSMWTKLSEKDRKNGNLPLMPLRGTSVEEINVSDSPLLYEGLNNLCGLRGLQTLILNNCPNIDDWCLDKISGRMRNTLKNLTIINCPRVTERGLTVLSRLKQLEKLHLNELPGVNHPGLVGILLEEAMPKCQVEGIDWETGEFVKEEILPSAEKKEVKKLHVTFVKDRKLK
uniref:Mitochondrial ATP synthase regulatory component factor B n=1 Tax=Strigamia maritima TaxID=126957 RepID=T1JEA6_STRMM